MSIASVYADPATTTRDAATLAKRAGVTYVVAAAFLRDQGASQVRKRTTKPSAAVFAPTGDLFGTWAADVLFMTDYAGVNSARTCILTLLEVNSRYVYARGLTKATSANTAKALVEIILQNAHDCETKEKAAPILKLRSDNGSEFAGEFAKLLLDQGIEHERVEAGTHARLARLDRFHRTLRMMIGELFALRDSHVWYDVLPEIIANYNSRPSRALARNGTPRAPVDIGPREEAHIRDKDYSRAQEIGDIIDDGNIGPGSRVRLQFSKTKAGAKSKFSKAQEISYTTEIYTVIQRVGPNSFLVDVPPGEITIWPLHSLQVVKKSLSSAVSGPKIDKAAVSAQRMEARNISPEEVKAVQAAPARPRSERAKKVDYRALAGL
jgi:hypothetical protein